MKAVEKKKNAKLLMLPIRWFNVDSELTCFLPRTEMHRMHESSGRVVGFSIFVNTQNNLWNTVSLSSAIFKFIWPLNLKHVVLYRNAY